MSEIKKVVGNYAKFEIKCEEIGFSRMHMIPIDYRGYVHQLAERAQGSNK